MVFPKKLMCFPCFSSKAFRKVPTWLSRASSQLPIGTLGGQGRTLAAADLPLGAMAPISDDLGGSCRIFGCRSSMDPKKRPGTRIWMTGIWLSGLTNCSIDFPQAWLYHPNVGCSCASLGLMCCANNMCQKKIH